MVPSDQGKYSSYPKIKLKHWLALDAVQQKHKNKVTN